MIHLTAANHQPPRRQGTTLSETLTVSEGSDTTTITVYSSSTASLTNRISEIQGTPGQGPFVSTTAIIGSPTTTTLTVQPTSGTSTPISAERHHNGLSTGAKAGIAIAIVLLFFILLGVIFIFFQRRKQRKHQHEKSLPPNSHELLTNANSHELFTKHNIPEMDEQNSGALKENLKLGLGIASMGLGDERPVSKEDLKSVQELDPRSRITALNTEEYVPSPHELETSHSSSAPQATDVQGRASSSTDQPPPANEERERKVELLTERMVRIREEKERLERIQELKDLEEQTKREILAAWRENGERS
ncbi:hypothetical protein N431DRAFT_523898 [Stipitochalara longipes BDJ]|nr:hypothetical protein N431DRAFT_523898 [Stipitochalara longipes BDJ]